MGKNMDFLKDMFVLTVATPLAGAAIGTVGGISGLSSGVKSATQTAIGGGLLSHASKMFKF